jgi:uncharacterized coiled-coil protein SlyX
MTHQKSITLFVWTCVWLASVNRPALGAEDSAEVKRQLLLLQQQNAALQAQITKQQELIDSLNRKVAEIQQANAQHDRQLDELKNDMATTENENNRAAGFNLGKVRISGEGGVGFFETGSQGMFPNSEFRVDEAKLFVETPIWENVFFFSEINLATRESSDLDLRLGELYVDFADVSQLWGRDRILNIRAGRLDVPFGEEYLSRDVIDNPLISHSLADLWGVDEGIELYGSIGKISYVLAVQNGGVPLTRDFDSDKSVSGRLSFDPAPWLHLSVSGMRTGELDATDDYLSEIWFGNGWFRSIGSPETTRFHANLVEGDVEVRFKRGHLKAFGGYVSYDDNDPNGNNQRDIYYYSIEGLFDVTRKFYAAMRFSQILVEDGYPISGHGMMDDYFFNYSPTVLTEDIWRLSIGLGYRFNRHLVVKAEYSFERGKTVGDGDREHEDLFAAEAAFGF